MSTRRIRRDAGWIDPERLPRGPGGRALCRYCGVEVPRGRRTFCSASCVHEWRLRSSPSYVRRRLFARDHGVCAVCGVDTVAQAQELQRRYRVPSWVQYGAHRPDVETARRYHDLRAHLQQLRIPWRRWNSRTRHRGIWDADHIVAVSEGGGECGLDNYRTLCLVCHADETAHLRARRRGEPSYQLF